MNSQNAIAQLNEIGIGNIVQFTATSLFSSGGIIREGNIVSIGNDSVVITSYPGNETIAYSEIGTISKTIKLMPGQQSNAVIGRSSDESSIFSTPSKTDNP